MKRSLRMPKPLPAPRNMSAWRLPSGQTLAEFAMNSGFLARPAMGVASFEQNQPTRRPPARARRSSG
ncbi:MAG: hypothetical protein ACRD96_19015 [Bryobacteraceae bacterium]